MINHCPNCNVPMMKFTGEDIETCPQCRVSIPSAAFEKITLVWINSVTRYSRLVPEFWAIQCGLERVQF